MSVHQMRSHGYNGRRSHITGVAYKRWSVFVQYAEETEEMAMTALSQNRQILERLADALYEKTKLSGFVRPDISLIKSF